MKLFTAVKDKLRYEYDKLRRRYHIAATNRCTVWQETASMDQTLDKLLHTDCSLCRFGDGEYKVMAGGKNGFQQADSLLAQRLRQVLRSDDPQILVGIPNIREDMDLRTPEARDFWLWCIREWGGSFSKMLKPGKQYYNAHVTRLYMDYRTSGRSADWFAKLKTLWQDRDLLIVEGEQTRLGIGNDLFAHAKSIKRVICPGKSAFSHYDAILEQVKDLWRGELVLIALGQTATVLAYDLHKAGIRAVDIGHVDIEYEWFLAGAEHKTAVAGKFVKEVDSQMTGQEDAAYLSQIVAKVGVE